jgi:hypothetical protein
MQVTDHRPDQWTAGGAGTHPVRQHHDGQLPDAVNDDQAILISDIFPIRWFGAKLAEVGTGHTVAALVQFQTEGEITPNPKRLCDDRRATDRIRASGRQNPIQHRHADGSLGLLSRKAARSQPWSDQRLVTTHCRFY